MTRDKGQPSPKDRVAAEVDRLLKKLPFADPTLKGDPPPPPRSPTGPRPSYPINVVKTPSATPLGTWGRVALGLVIIAAMTQWPYASACGISLLAYLVGVGGVILTGAWSAMLSWKLRISVAHVVSLMIVFWGIVLAAEQILPRVGYAKAEAVWLCTS